MASQERLHKADIILQFQKQRTIEMGITAAVDVTATAENKEVREKYLQNHVGWFLKNHQNSLREFEASVEDLYGADAPDSGQLRLFEGQENGFD